MLELPEEIWRPVPSRGRLEASSHGRIRVAPRIGHMPNGAKRTYQTSPTFGSVTSAVKGARHVYFGRHIKEIGNVKVHRAVCEAFHGPAPFEKAVVIHLNENAHDNRPGNLRWGTQKENLNMPKFKEYNRKAKKVLVRKDASAAPTTADIYIGLPQLLAEIDKRSSLMKRAA